MLVIRMQRTGRKGHAMFRVVVQDSRLTPTSGKVVARLGSYDPHTKAVILDKEKAAFYLEHGAQPSDRAAGLLKAESVKLPSWVKLPAKKERGVRNVEKRRSTAPAKPVEEAVAEPEAPAAEAAAEAKTAETSNETQAPAEAEVAVVEETPAETEAPAETEPTDTTEETASETAKPEPENVSEPVQEAVTEKTAETPDEEASGKKPKA